MSEIRHVLVADDVEVNRLLVQAILEQAGHRVDTVADGNAATAAAATMGYDAIFLDLAMPGLDGIGSARAIRALERRQGRRPARLMALTGGALAAEGGGATRDACLAAGMDGVLTKPVNPRVLLAALTAARPDPGPGARLAALRRSLQREAGDPAGTARNAAALAVLAGLPPLCNDGGRLQAAARRLEALALSADPADSPAHAIDAVLAMVGRRLAAAGP